MPTKTSASHKSVKHSIIEKANNNTVLAVGVAVFIVIFCAFAAKALLTQSLYLGRVIDEKEKALKQIEENAENLAQLKTSYDAFVGESINILGGNPNGIEGPLDGNNADLVLDALPNKYDFPALSSSFEKILRDGGYTIESIGGAEDAGLASSTVATKDAIAIVVPYSFSFSDTTERTKQLLQTLERSIRPMYVDTLKTSSSSDNILKTDITLHTFFTAEKTFQVGSKEIEQ